VQVIKVAYRTLLEVGRQPICALNIQIDPQQIDVNVHPRKLEVRFSDPQRVHSHIIRLLSDFLAATPWLSGVSQRQEILVEEQISPQRQAAFAVPLQTNISIEENAAISSDERVKENEGFSALSSQLEALSNTPSFSLTHNHDNGPAKKTHQLTPQFGLGRVARFSHLRVVGQVGGLFLLLESNDAMLILDQHAAHERVVFERLRKQYAQKQMNSQRLLIPVQVHVNREEMAALQDNQTLIESYGFELEAFGTETIAIKALPQMLKVGEATLIAKDLLRELVEAGQNYTMSEQIDRICAKMACHGSVRAGQILSTIEIQELLIQLDEIQYGGHCPHGRPVVQEIPFIKIAKWFDRH